MDYQETKIAIPINVKLAGIVLLVTGAALAIYIYLAVSMFKTDKMAYVFESVEAQGQQVAQNLNNYFINIEQIHMLLHELTKNSGSVEQLFRNHPEIQAILEFKKSQLVKKFLQNTDVDISALIKKADFQEGFKTLAQSKFLQHTLNRGERVSIILFNQSKIKELLPESSLYQFYLTLEKKYLTESYANDSDLLLENYLYQTTVINDDIASVVPVLDKKILLLTTVKRKQALAAATQLQSRSVYYGGLIGAIIIFIILFVSRIFTHPIRRLYSASQELAKANFSYRVEINQKDEIGVLGNSFNYMAGQIENYIVEMEEKNRLENELQTARLVQKSFFPYSSVNNSRLELNSYYQPASECGGDWWGHLHFDELDIVILVDVTGHGTAAALLTAVIHGCLAGIKNIGKRDSTFLNNPAMIMKYLNESFCSVDINLNATAFVMILNQDELRYSNASHNPPYLIAHKKDLNYSKKDILPLMEANSVRLGESLGSEYAYHTQKIQAEDHIVLCTDGILEAKNHSGKIYGTRNFTKSLIQALNSNEKNITKKMMQEFHDFMGQTLPDDDITLINLRLRNMKIYLHHIEQTDEVKKKIKEYNLKIVKNPAESEVIIYSDTFRNMITEVENTENIHTFVTIKDFLVKKNFLQLNHVESDSSSPQKFKDETITEVTQKVDKLVGQCIDGESFGDLEKFLKLVSIELIQNALIYGRANNCLDLVDYEITRGADNYLIMVKDRYGKLGKETLLSNIKRAFTEKTYETKKEGAGLGLSIILSASDEMSLQRKEGEFTEIRCIINKYKRLKEYKSKKTSLIFMEN